MIGVCSKVNVCSNTMNQMSELILQVILENWNTQSQRGWKIWYFNTSGITRVLEIMWKTNVMLWNVYLKVDISVLKFYKARIVALSGLSLDKTPLTFYSNKISRLPNRYSYLMVMLSSLSKSHKSLHCTVISWFCCATWGETKEQTK